MKPISTWCVSTALLALTLLGGCREASAPSTANAEKDATAAASSLRVEGSAFVLTTADGRVLRGAELQGATVYLAVGGDAVAPVRLTSIVVDDQHPDILRHEFSVSDEQGGWKSACEPNAYGERWGFPVSLPEGHPGREHAITLTCASGAVGKCARFGYRPWARSAEGESLAPLHAACVRMARGDYCGDGEAHTKNGTSIDIYDDLQIQTRGEANDPSYEFEAGWTPEGAVCVQHSRWSDLITLQQLKTQCPRLAAVPVCDETNARALGAKLFNRSRLLPARTAAGA
jgi:hypothetical protein